MLENVKQEIYPVHEFDTTVQTIQTQASQANPGDKRRPLASQARTQATKDLSKFTSQNEDEKSVPSFGWEQIENGPLLPFVNRDSKPFVACHIVTAKVFRNITSVFSYEMMRCISFKIYRMTHGEASAFNEININHCDKSIVGAYIFKPEDYMVTLESVKKFVKFFRVCRNSIMYKKENYLFGFIRIDGQNEVPFVWSGAQKLVPLFYFEGQNQYIDAKSKDLLDPWLIGYLTFCFKVQKIKQEIYMQSPLKVVNFKDVETLFPIGTTFELYWPENINPELLAPEMRTTFPVAEVTRKRPAQLSADLKAKRPRTHIVEASSQPQMVNKTSPALQKNEVQTITRLEGPQQLVVDPQLLGGQRDPAITPVTYHQQSNVSQVDRVPARRCGEELARITPVFKVNEQSQSVELRAPSEIPKQNLRGRIDDCGATRRLQMLARATFVPADLPSPSDLQPNLCTNTTNTTERLTEKYHITNVSRRSPQVASSPGVRQTSPFMTEARETVETHLQNNNFVPSDLPSELLQQTCIPNQQYYHQEQFLGYSHTQVKEQRSSNARSVQNKLINLSNNKNSLTRPQTALPPINTLISRNSKLLNFRRSSTNVYQQRVAPLSLPDPSLKAKLKQLAAEETKLSKSLKQNMQKFQLLQQQKNHLLQQQNSVPVCPPAINDINQTYENGPFLVSAGYQSVPSSTPPPIYRQHYADTNIPVVQNVNVAVTNLLVAENRVQHHSGLTTNRYWKEDMDKIQFTVMEHLLHTGLNQQSYTIKELSIRDKTLLGIRRTLIANDFLINFSEFASEVLAVDHEEKQWQLTIRFKTLYKLNCVQKEVWGEAVKKRLIQFVGPIKEVFVEYIEATFLLKSIDLRTLYSHQ